MLWIVLIFVNNFLGFANALNWSFTCKACNNSITFYDCANTLEGFEKQRKHENWCQSAVNEKRLVKKYLKIKLIKKLRKKQELVAIESEKADFNEFNWEKHKKFIFYNFNY